MRKSTLLLVVATLLLPDDNELQWLDLSKVGMFRAMKDRVKNAENFRAKCGFECPKPNPPGGKGGVLWTTMAAKRKEEKALVVPCSRVRALLGGGIPPLSTGPPGAPPRTILITSDQADALLSPYYTFQEYDAIGYDEEQYVLEIFEIPFGNWLADHFVGPLAEGLHHGRRIGTAHRVRQ